PRMPCSDTARRGPIMGLPGRFRWARGRILEASGDPQARRVRESSLKRAAARGHPAVIVQKSQKLIYNRFVFEAPDKIPDKNHLVDVESIEFFELAVLEREPSLLVPRSEVVTGQTSDFEHLVQGPVE